ncbi:MAG: hypothetical protein QOI23_446 [Chloroflexota bacterium]|nr:hypothetical protein [Chloroflexota bacterium]
MRNLLRKPLPWIVICECAIVAALAMVAWHMVASPQLAPASRVQAAAPATPAGHQVSPTPKTSVLKAPVQPLLPGLNLDPGFWRQRLGDLNRGESSFEQLEWRIVHSAMDTARRYVKSVVMPALVRAERGVR